LFILSSGTCIYNIGALCANLLADNEDEFAPFCEYNATITNYKDYVASVRTSHDWGGHLELRAISMALRRPVHIYSIQTREPVIIDASAAAVAASSSSSFVSDDQEATTSTSNHVAEPIRLSYHLHYYALGEHYNRVVAAESTTVSSPPEDEYR
jgi:OTU domain-containing protein 6